MGSLAVRPFIPERILFPKDNFAEVHEIFMLPTGLSLLISYCVLLHGITEE